MTWILIVLNLSSWDGSVSSKIELGDFTKQQDCMNERFRLEQQNGSASTRFVCAEKPNH